MKRWQRLLADSPAHLARLASALALAALSLFCISVLWAKPLFVIGAMSVGHVLGAAAFSCYLLAVVTEMARRGRLSVPPEAESARERARK